jgi:hypothetical protein
MYRIIKNKLTDPYNYDALGSVTVSPIFLMNEYTEAHESLNTIFGKELYKKKELGYNEATNEYVVLYYRNTPKYKKEAMHIAEQYIKNKKLSPP